MPAQNSYFISRLYKLEFRKIKGDLANQKALKLVKYNKGYLPDNLQPLIRISDPKS